MKHIDCLERIYIFTSISMHMSPVLLRTVAETSSRGTHPGRRGACGQGQQSVTAPRWVLTCHPGRYRLDPVHSLVDHQDQADVCRDVEGKGHPSFVPPRMLTVSFVLWT